MGKQDPYRFNLRFDDTDEDHRKVCEFLNTCGRKKTRYIVKAFLAYWGKGSGGEAAKQSMIPEAEKEKPGENVREEKKPVKEEKEHLVSIDESNYAADQAEVSLMMKNYQMFDLLGKET